MLFASALTLMPHLRGVFVLGNYREAIAKVVEINWNGSFGFLYG